jgi:hypothetical protein
VPLPKPKRSPPTRLNLTRCVGSRANWAGPIKVAPGVSRRASPPPENLPRSKPAPRTGFLWPDVKVAKLSISATGAAPVPKLIRRLVELGAEGEEMRDD